MAHPILAPSYERLDDRGVFREVLNEGSWEALNAGELHVGAILGNHYHKKTIVFFYLLSGSVEIKTLNIQTGEADKFNMHTNQGVYLHPDETHRILFLEQSHFIMLKSRHYNATDPDTYSYPIPG